MQIGNTLTTGQESMRLIFFRLTFWTDQQAAVFKGEKNALVHAHVIEHIARNIKFFETSVTEEYIKIYA